MTLHDYIRDPAPEPSLSASVAHLLLEIVRVVEESMTLRRRTP